MVIPWDLLRIECTFFCCNLNSVSFRYCPRKANMTVDILASKSEGSCTMVWQAELPDVLVDVLANDVTLFPHEI